MQKNWPYYLLLLVLFGGVFLIEFLRPKPVDWSFTLNEKDKIPYGTYVFHRLLPELFPDNAIVKNPGSMRKFYTEHKEDKSTRNYLFINQFLSFDKTESKALLDMVAAGNNVFIATFKLRGNLKDSLHLEMNRFNFLTQNSDTLRFTASKKLPQRTFDLDKHFFDFYIEQYDTLHTKILALRNKNKACLIKTRRGKGNFYIFSMPEMFTNYALITSRNFAGNFATMSYLPDKEIVLNLRYSSASSRNSGNMFVYILRTRGFKQAFFLILTTFLLFMLFTAKRKQRPIPVITPPENQSAKFIHTLGRLYYHSKNHKQIAMKRFLYLQHFIAQKYNFRIENLEDVIPEDLGQQTGADAEKTKHLLKKYAKIKAAESISAEELNTVNQSIEEFYETCK